MMHPLRALTRGISWWSALLVLSGGIAAGFVLDRLTRPPAGPPRDLLPSFGERVVELLQRMQARGYDPILVQSPPTPNALTLTAYGAGIHVVSESAGTSDLGFFQALGQEAANLDLAWGGRWTGAAHDSTYVQAIPLFLESEFRGLETTAARERFLRETYAG